LDPALRRQRDLYPPGAPCPASSSTDRIRERFGLRHALAELCLIRIAPQISRAATAPNARHTRTSGNLTGDGRDMRFVRIFSGTNRWRPSPGLVLSLVLLALGSPVRADDPLEDYKLAIGYYKKEQWSLAAESFQSFLKNHSDHTKSEPARFYYGLTLVKLDDFKKAREVLRNFARDFPKSPNVISAEYWIGHCSYFLDDFAHAENELGRFAADAPENPLMQWALPYLADSELRLKKPEVALKHFQQALERFPHGEMAEDARFGLAKCYEALKRTLEAIAAV